MEPAVFYRHYRPILGSRHMCHPNRVPHDKIATTDVTIIRRVIRQPTPSVHHRIVSGCCDFFLHVGRRP